MSKTTRISARGRTKKDAKGTKIYFIATFNSASTQSVYPNEVLEYISFRSKFIIILELNKKLKEIVPPSAYPIFS